MIIPRSIILALLSTLLAACTFAIDPTFSPLPTPNPAPASLAVSIPPPQTLDALLDKAPLILIGEVGPVTQYLDFAAYGDDGQLLERGPNMPEVPATDFVLNIKEVIRDDGSVASGMPIILRMPGTATAQMKLITAGGDYPFSFTGDHHLFLLAPNPDEESYGFYFGPWSRLIMDGEILRVSNGAQSPLQFADSDEPITLEEFIQYVKAQ